MSPSLNPNSGCLHGIRCFVLTSLVGEQLHCEQMDLPGPVLPFPALDGVLDAGQARRSHPVLLLVLDQSLCCRPVPAHLAEQVIEQRGFPQRAAEQLLGDLRLPAQLPHHGLDPQRKPALRAQAGRLLFFRTHRVNQIDSAMRAFHQPMINIRAAIAAFGLIVFGWGSDTGGHGGPILSCHAEGRSLPRSIPTEPCPRLSPALPGTCVRGRCAPGASVGRYNRLIKMHRSSPGL